MEPEPIIVRVRHNVDIKFIAVRPADLNPSTFAYRTARAFEITLKEGDKVKFYDNLGTPIPESLFSLVIKNFHRGSNFFVDVEFQMGKDQRPFIHTARMLKDYFEEKNELKLVIDCSNATKSGKDLTDEQKSNCVKLIADYAVHYFGLSINKNQTQEVAVAAISLIEGLKSKTGEPTDILINSTSTGLGGRLYNRLRYMKTVERNEKNQDAPPVSQDVDPQHSMNELLWLKTVVVADEDIEEIRAKLDSTRLLRDAMVLRDDIELIQEFSLFFTHPLLILDDFVLKVKASKISINSNAFLETWPQMSQRLDQVLQTYYPRQAFDMEWSIEIKTFLILIRLLPFRPGARSLSSVETFQNTTKRLLVFSNAIRGLSPVMEKHQNTQPFIIAKGESKDSIDEFSIFLDNNEICLPPGFSFAQTIDLYFKIHEIFGIKFDERLQHAMFFLKHYIYKMKEGNRKPTTKLIELYNRLESIELL